jgi:hypothetical protein
VNRDDEESLELEPPKPVNMSTSHTLALSEDPPVDPEMSTPAHGATETSPSIEEEKGQDGRVW